MNRLFLLYFLSGLIALLCSCSDNQEVKIPSTVLPKEKMVQVLADIHLLEAAASLNLLPNDEGALKNDPNYQQIYSAQGTTREQYMESFDFYSQHSELMMQIYNEVLTELSKRQAKEGQ